MATTDLTATIRRLFLYDDWANREVLASLRRASDPPARARTLLGHIIGASEVWLERLTRRGRAVDVWPDHSLDECAARLDSLRSDWASLLSGLDDARFAEDVHYANQAGVPFTSTPSDILMHVATHGGYHRGQIAILLGAAGHASANTDFIVGALGGKFDDIS